MEEGKIDAASLKGNGNRLFGNGDYIGALQYYDQAVIKAQDGAAEDEGAKELLAALHFNRAACYWKIATIKNQQLRAQEQGSTGGANTKDKGDNDDETDAYMRLALKKEGGDGQAELKRCEKECRLPGLVRFSSQGSLPPRCSSSCIK